MERWKQPGPAPTSGWENLVDRSVARRFSKSMLCPRPNPGASLRLFCLPYAGGRAGMFLGLAADLPGNVEMCAVELPGHGGRLREVPFTRLRPLVEHVTDALAEHLDKPFALFGYSMGALLAFEIARELARRGWPSPSAVLVAAAKAPHVPSAYPPVHDLPRSGLIEQLGRIDGSRNALLQHEGFVDLMLPVVRADLAVCETYAYEPAPPLDCPLAAFGGLVDPSVPRLRLEAWRDQTTGDFSSTMLPGGHFFLDSSRALFAERLGAELERIMDRLGCSSAC
jgi:medium-chain acyl-[acyl-carrier-protein] hydrolase